PEKTLTIFAIASPNPPINPITTLDPPSAAINNGNTGVIISPDISAKKETNPSKRTFPVNQAREEPFLKFCASSVSVFSSFNG
ncbi:MAG: hypothetical protein ACXAC6_16580, partial [Candidatus Hodarchaeales archaeon]